MAEYDDQTAETSNHLGHPDGDATDRTAGAIDQLRLAVDNLLVHLDKQPRPTHPGTEEAVAPVRRKFREAHAALRDYYRSPQGQSDIASRVTVAMDEISYWASEIRDLVSPGADQDPDDATRGEDAPSTFTVAADSNHPCTPTAHR